MAPPFTAANGGRQLGDVRVDERTLREVYLLQFEAAVKQGKTGSLMCSYNKVNGTYACENPHTLLQVLDGEWGFKGMVVADYGASKDTAGNMNNGLDFIPDEGQVDYAYTPQLLQAALATGQVSRATLDTHVLRILRTLVAFGVCDRPSYVNSDSQINVAADQQAALGIEQRAITLLKNDGVLPLKAGIKKIAVIGPYPNRFVPPRWSSRRGTPGRRVERRLCASCSATSTWRGGSPSPSPPRPPSCRPPAIR